MVASYTFDQTEMDFVKRQELVNKKPDTKYEYSPDGLQCKVTILIPYTTAMQLHGHTGKIKLSQLDSLDNSGNPHDRRTPSLMDLPDEILADIVNFPNWMIFKTYLRCVKDWSRLDKLHYQNLLVTRIIFDRIRLFFAHTILDDETYEVVSTFGQAFSITRVPQYGTFVDVNINDRIYCTHFIQSSQPASV